MDDVRQVAIQGERGSNSHLAAMEMLGDQIGVLPCHLSAEVVDAVTDGRAQAALLPIENSLHGSVAEHYDLLLHAPLCIVAEHELRIQHDLIAAPGVMLEAIRRVLSHPVALSQCRRFLAGFTQARAEPFYDTAGSVRHIVEHELRDTAAIAPPFAAEVYGAEVLRSGLEDHTDNYTRFHLLRRDALPSKESKREAVNKLSAAFSVEHRPGTLARTLQALTMAGADLTRIESRPVPGHPWEYIFFVDCRFYHGNAGAEAVLAALRQGSHMVKELGRYPAAGRQQ